MIFISVVAPVQYSVKLLSYIRMKITFQLQKGLSLT